MHYNWKDSASTIRNIEIISPHKEKEAVIFTPEGVDPKLLQAVPEKLREHGFVATPDIEGDQHVLRVQPIKNEAAFFKALAAEGLTSGTPDTNTTEYDHKPKEEFSTVKAAGWTYLLADCLLMASGIVRKSYAEAGTGAVWATTGLALGLYGKKDPDVQKSYIYQDLETHLANSGVDLSHEDTYALKNLAAKDGVFARVERFIRTHPIEFNNTLQAAGGLLMVQGGYQQKSPFDDKTRNYYKMGAGAAVFTGQSLGITMPQRDNPYSKKAQAERQAQAVAVGDTPAANDPTNEGKRVTASIDAKQQTTTAALEPLDDKRSTVQKTRDWFDEKPLRYSMVLPIANNLLNLASVADELPKMKTFIHDMHPKMLADVEARIQTAKDTGAFKDLEEKLIPEKENLADRLERAQDYKIGAGFNLGAAVCYIVANSLYGASKRDINSDLAQTGGLDEICNTVAHVASHQSAATQDQTINQISGFLSAQDGISQSMEEVSQRIHSKIDLMAHNPWEKSETMVAHEHHAPEVGDVHETTPNAIIHAANDPQHLVAPQHAHQI